MPLAKKGFQYEEKVINAIRTVGVVGNIVEAAGASATADADILLNGVIHPLEIKLDSRAQMGGYSARYSNIDNKIDISFTETLDEPMTEVLSKTVFSKSNELDELLQFLSLQAPPEINLKTNKFPVFVTKEAWNNAAQNNLLVNTRFKSTIDFVHRHYSKKGIHYMQIGDSGLFYLESNPACLPIPQLDCDINIELRTARSGSKKGPLGFAVCSGGIRIQARLQNKIKSPHTLDCPEGIRELLATLKNDYNRQVWHYTIL